MGTSACVGQAAGMAAALCHRHQVMPRQLLQDNLLNELQLALLRSGQYIPQVIPADPHELVKEAVITASSEYVLYRLLANGQHIPLDAAMGQMLPLKAGKIPTIAVYADAATDTVLEVSLRTASRQQHHTPDVTLRELSMPLHKGSQAVELSFDIELPEDHYIFLCFMKNDHVNCAAARKG